MVKMVLGGANLSETGASVTARLYGEPTTRYGDAHPWTVNGTLIKSTLHLKTFYPVGIPLGSAFLGSGLFADAGGVRVPGLSYTGGEFLLRRVLSLVLERFLLNLIGVFERCQATDCL